MNQTVIYKKIDLFLLIIMFVTSRGVINLTHPITLLIEELKQNISYDELSNEISSFTQGKINLVPSLFQKYAKLQREPPIHVLRELIKYGRETERLTDKTFIKLTMYLTGQID